MRRDRTNVESHNMGGHRIEHHHDNDMHKDHHEKAYGHMNRGYHEMHRMGGHAPESMYEGIKGMPMREVHKLENSGGGRMARQYRQREAMRDVNGKHEVAMDDTVYGKFPPTPGKIDS